LRIQKENFQLIVIISPKDNLANAMVKKLCGDCGSDWNF